MADSIDRKQLKEELNSALGRDGQTDDLTKHSGTSSKKKRSRSKKTKDCYVAGDSDGKPDNQVCSSSPTSDLPALLSANTSNQSQPTKSGGSKSSRKKDKGLNPNSGSANKFEKREDDGSHLDQPCKQNSSSNETSKESQGDSMKDKKQNCNEIPMEPLKVKKQNSGEGHEESKLKSGKEKKQNLSEKSEEMKQESAKQRNKADADNGGNVKEKKRVGDNGSLGKQSQKLKDKSLSISKDSGDNKSDSQRTGKVLGKIGGDAGADGKGSERGTNVNNNKPRPAKLGEEELTEEMMKSLAENKMHALKKPNQKFRNARYFCRLCDFHLDQLEDCVKHMKDNRHCRRKEISEVDALLRLIPEPSEAQLAALTLAVENVWNVKAIGPAEQSVRQEIVTRLETFLQQDIPDVLLHMYGSSLTGFGLKGADINVNLSSSDKERKLTFLLKEVHSTMRDKPDSGFSQVRADFSAKVPVLLLTDDTSGLVVTMVIHCYSAHCSSELLAIYSDMDLRVKKLIIAFRYWAHLCGLDRHKDGFIPPQALNIMVIYFFQNLNPQLIPIINPPKVSGEDVGDFRLDEPGFSKMKVKAMKHAKDTRNEMSLGELWVRLLRFYSIEFDTGGVVVSIRSSQPVPRTSKPWNCKKLAVEDPYMMKKNITRMVNNSRIFEYWQDSIRKAFYYFGLPRGAEGKSLISEEDLKAKSLVSEQPEKTLASENSSLHKSSTNNKTTKLEKSAPLTGDQSKEAKTAPGASSDQGPVMIAPNPLLASKSQPDGDKLKSTSAASKSGDLELSKSRQQPVSMSQTECDNLVSETSKLNCADLSTTPVLAGSASMVESAPVNQSLSSPVSLLKTIEQEELRPASSAEMQDRLRQFALSFAEGIIATAVSTVSNLESEDEGIIRDSAPGSSDQCPALTVREGVPPSPITDTPSHGLTADSGVGASLMVKTECLDSQNDTELGGESYDLSATCESCIYDFDKNYFTDGKGPTLVCTFCEKEGHLKNACPEDELPEVLSLPEMTDHHLKVLSETLKRVPSEVGLSEESIRERWHFLRSLQGFIQYQFDDAQLTLFGSTCNGFGFDKSDMDICMTFSRRNGKIDKVHVIETLARRLKNYGELYNVQAISTAKVPIVKFQLRYNELEGDISLYNTLAQQNTKLLHCYSLIDPRVRILGYAIKTFAKVCDIGDASRGSLSSYAYILMMLYYLQQVQPPVIPVLQELYKGRKKPEFIVEDCDAWFMEDLERLEEFWPDRGANTMSVAQLWLGFLRFYVEEFNYKEFVVSIRQRALLTRFEKLWNGTCIAVEDPFDLSHNLGSGLTRKMNNFIFKTFINGRMLYGSPIDHNMDLFKSYQRPSDYFFDTELLSENRPPNVRGCRRCGKIGHLVRACPLNRKDREDEEQKQKQHRQQQQQIKMSQASGGRTQQSQMMSGKPQDRGHGSHRQSQGHQQYKDRDTRERDRWHGNNIGSGGSGNMNSRHYGGAGAHSAGNTNRNSSATPAGHNTPPNYVYPQFNLPPGGNLGHQQQQHRANLSSQTYHNSSYHQKQQQQYHQNQHQQPPHPHHLHHQFQRQHQQQQQRHHQQEQQRHAVMAKSRGTPIHHAPPGFSMQPIMASTPRPNMNLAQRPPPPPGYGGMRPPLHPMPSQQQQGGYMPGLLPSPNQQLYGGGQGGGGANQQGMNPLVQSLFSSAKGQVLNMDSTRQPNSYH